MQDNIPAKVYKYKTGKQLVMRIYCGTTGRSEYLATARDIVSSRNKDELVEYISDILEAIEVIKNNERNVNTSHLLDGYGIKFFNE